MDTSPLRNKKVPLAASRAEVKAKLLFNVATIEGHWRDNGTTTEEYTLAVASLKAQLLSLGLDAEMVTALISPALAHAFSE